jgi:hypothetical protein
VCIFIASGDGRREMGIITNILANLHLKVFVQRKDSDRLLGVSRETVNESVQYM